MPAFNAATTVAHAIASVQAQTVRDWELWVVDDGSTDDTARCVSSLAAADPRVQLLSGDHAGAAAARNQALTRARAPLLAFLDADDWWAPDFLARMLAVAAPDAAAVCNHARTDHDGRRVGRVYRHAKAALSADDFAGYCPCAIHAVVVPTAVVRRVGGFDTALRTAEDWDLWLKVARTGLRLNGVDQVLAFYRDAPGSLTKQGAELVRDARTVLERAAAPYDLAPADAGAARHGYGPNWVRRKLPGAAAWIVGVAAASGTTPGAIELGPLHVAELGDIRESLREGLAAGCGGDHWDLRGRWPVARGPVQNFLKTLEASSGAAGLCAEILSQLDAIFDEPGQRDEATHRLRGPLTWRQVLVGGAGDVGDRVSLRLRLGRRRVVVTTPAWRARLDLATRWRLVGQLGGKLARRLMRTSWIGSAAARLRRVKGRSFVVLSKVRRRLGVAAARLHRLQGAVTQGAPRHRDADSWDEFFEHADPWNYDNSYEADKFAQTLAILPAAQPIERALELACAEGHFTRHLAPRVRHLLATDISAKALQRAAQRCSGLGDVEFRTLDFMNEAIPGDQDLIVCSEVLYFCETHERLQAVIAQMAQALRPGGLLVTTHAHVVNDGWGFDWGTAWGAATIARAFDAQAGVQRLACHANELYRIDLYQRPLASPPDAPSQPSTAWLPVRHPMPLRVERHAVWGGPLALRETLRRHRRTLQIPVLMYHRITNEPLPGLQDYAVSPQAFERQMRYLRRRGFHGLRLQEFIEARSRGLPLPGRPVLITFDDAYVDLAETAGPILARYDFGATVFVPTAHVGETAAWDDSGHGAARLLDWGQIRQLAQAGLDFASHAHRHHPAVYLDSQTLRQDMAASQRLLHQHLGQVCPVVAPPYGIVDDRVRQVLRAEGIDLVFGTQPGWFDLARPGTDVPRLDIHGAVSLHAFAAMLAPYGVGEPDAIDLGPLPSDPTYRVVPPWDGFNPTPATG